MANQFFTQFVTKHIRLIKEQGESVRHTLDQDKPLQTIYVFRFPSRILGNLLAEVCRQNQLPVPSYTEKQSTAEHSIDTKSSFAFLRGRGGTELFLNQRRTQRARIESQLAGHIARHGAEKVRFIPVTFTVGSAPRPLSPVAHFPFDFPFLPLGEIWTALLLLIYRNRIRIDIGPVTPPGKSSLVEGQEGLSIFQRLSLLIYRKERRVRASAPNRRHSSELSVLQTGEVKREIMSLAQERALTNHEASERGKKYLREIAARFSLPVIGFLRILLSFVFGRVFEQIETLNVNRYREVAGEHPIILLPNHRSHFDYLLLTYALDREGLALPYIAAGDNLNFFGIGWFLRRAGGFFIRRKVEDDPLYKLILNHYLTYLLKQGHTIEFYIEGGRSRSGAMLRPRLGLLKYIVRSILTGTRRDVYFVPVGISYERVAEDEILARERLGHPKQRESFFNALKLANITKKRFGTVSIQFGEPISLRSLVKTMGDRNGAGVDPIERAVERTEVASRSLLPELSPFSAKLAKLVVRDIEKNIPISTSAIASAAMLSFENYSASRRALAERALCFLELISYGMKDITASNWRGALLHSNLSISTPLKQVIKKPDPVVAVVEMLDRLHGFGLFIDRSTFDSKPNEQKETNGSEKHPAPNPTERAEESLSYSDEVGRALCRYYAGGIFHHLTPLLLTTVSAPEDGSPGELPRVLQSCSLPILQPTEELLEQGQRIRERIQLVREHEIPDSVLRSGGLLEGEKLEMMLHRLATRLCGELE